MRGFVAAELPHAHRGSTPAREWGRRRCSPTAVVLPKAWRRRSPGGQEGVREEEGPREKRSTCDEEDGLRSRTAKMPSGGERIHNQIEKRDGWKYSWIGFFL